MTQGFASRRHLARRRLPRRLLLVATALALAGCLRFDNFVFENVPIADMNANLMAKSQVPAGEYREQWINEADGTKVDSWLLFHDGSATDTTPAGNHAIALLYCHGQDNNVETDVPRTDLLWLMGYTVLAFDYRGTGKTQGTSTEKNVDLDTEAAYDWLAGQPGYSVAIYGRSLGTAMCLHAAVDRHAAALVLESPIASIPTIINDSTGLVTPSDYYVDTIFDNLTEIQGFTGELLIMHGTADTYVPPKYGEELHSLAQGHASVNQLWLVPGADHSTVPCTDKTDPAAQNSCNGGGIPAGVSADYMSHVNAFYEAAFGS